MTTLAGRRAPITPASRPAIIPGLDGLRALAIAAVLVYHLRPTALPGGFIGVDIFFVVSGFLITTLLLREIAKNRYINLVGFWLRRARRLLPALTACVLVSITLAYFVGGDLLVGIGRQAAGALTFSNNWVEISAGSSYFAQTSPQLFVNFWSLAVEEQFYLVWPLALATLLALTRTVSARVKVVLAVGAASAVWMAIVAVPGADATRAYYGTDTHLFGLMIGAALALMWSRSSALDGRAWRRWRIPASLLALVVLGALLKLTSEDSIATFRGLLALACLATGVLIAALITGRHPLLPLFESAPVRWVGERSYGIYLWHWPVIVVLAALAPTAGGAGEWVLAGVALALTLAVAACSYRYLETPVRRYGFIECGRLAARAVRRRGARWPRAIAAGAAACLLITPVAIATAPEKSATQAQIEAGEKALAEQAAPTLAAGAATLDASAPAGAEISAFGDSLLVTTIHALRDRFPQIAVDAKSNRQWPEGLAHIRAALDRGEVRRAVVIALGTNGGLKDPAVLEDALDALGGNRLVVVVNLYGKSTWITDVNEDIEEVVARHPNAIVADWNGAISAHRDLLQSDGVHPGIEGAHVYADTIKDAFEELSARIADAR